MIFKYVQIGHFKWIVKQFATFHFASLCDILDSFVIIIQINSIISMIC